MTLVGALNQLTVDQLKPLAALLRKPPPTRKELVEYLAKTLLDPARVRKLHAGFGGHRDEMVATTREQQPSQVFWSMLAPLVEHELANTPVCDGKLCYSPPEATSRNRYNLVYQHAAGSRRR